MTRPPGVVEFGRVVLPAARVLLLLAASLLPAAEALALPEGPAYGGAEGRPIAAVKYRSAEHVYLSSGSDDGLAAGQRLEVYRVDRRIGLVEVVFVASRSTTCRVIEETVPIRKADIVRTQGEPVGAGALEPLAKASMTASTDERSGDAPERTATVSTPLREQESSRYVPAWRTRQSLSGSVAVEIDRFSDADLPRRDNSRLAFRGNLRLRNIGGRPYSVYLRMSSRRLSRGTGWRSLAPRTETRQRLYELAVHYEPPDGRLSVKAGRLRVAPSVGTGFLDGVLAEAKVSPALGVGGFFGSVPDVQRVGFRFDARKYGAFARLRKAGTSNGSDVEMVVAAVREELPSGGTADMATVETRVSSGTRVTLYQRAEIDLGRSVPGGVDNTATLGNLSVAAFVRTQGSARLSISFDRWNRFPALATEFALPETLREQVYARTSFRVGYHFTGPWHTNLSAQGGVRGQGDGSEATYFGGVNAYWFAANGASFGGGIQYSSGRIGNTVVANLRAAKTFASRYRLAATYGFLGVSGVTVDGGRTSQWIRASADVDLSRNVFVEGGLEVSRGRDLHGRRLDFVLGYRF